MYYRLYYNMSTWVLSCFSHVQFFATLWTVALQVRLSMRFSRQEYWSGLPCPPPGIPESLLLPYTGIKLTLVMSLALADEFFTINAICNIAEAYIAIQKIFNLHEWWLSNMHRYYFHYKPKAQSFVISNTKNNLLITWTNIIEYQLYESESVNWSVVPDSLWHHGL